MNIRIKLLRDAVSIIALSSVLLFMSGLAVSADTSSYIWINGVQLSSGEWLENGSTVPNTGSVHNAEYEDGILTLNGAVVNSSYKSPVAAGGIFSSGDLQIVLNGSNSINTPDITENRNDGIYVTGNLVISGSGSLTILAGSTDANYSSGINAHDITVNDSVVLSSTGGSTGSYGYSSGILCDKLILNDYSSVSAVGGSGGSSGGNYGVAADSVEINGSASLAATCKDCDDRSFGILSYGDIVVGGNTSVTTSSSKNAEFSYGIQAYSDLMLKNNAVINSNGGDNSRFSYGLFSYNAVSAGDKANITASSGTGNIRGYGIRATNNVTISGKADALFSGSTLAMFNLPDITSYENASASVNLLSQPDGASAWNKTDDLGGDNSLFKYVKLFSGEELQNTDITLVSANVIAGNKLEIVLNVAIKRDNPNVACIALIPLFSNDSASPGKMLAYQRLDIPGDGNNSIIKTVTFNIPKPAGNKCIVEYYLLNQNYIPVQNPQALEISY